MRKEYLNHMLILTVVLESVVKKRMEIRGVSIMLHQNEETSLHLSMDVYVGHIVRDVFFSSDAAITAFFTLSLPDAVPISLTI